MLHLPPRCLIVKMLHPEISRGVELGQEDKKSIKAVGSMCRVGYIDGHQDVEYALSVQGIELGKRTP